VRLDLKAYENQARLSIMLGVISAAAALAGAALVAQRFSFEHFWTSYNAKTIRLPMILATILVALVAGAAGVLLGLNSAGQRRNSKSKLSWTGFFLNAGMITLALCVFVFFWITKFDIAK
jgi:hypothetical protein